MKASLASTKATIVFSCSSFTVVYPNCNCIRLTQIQYQLNQIPLQHVYIMMQKCIDWCCCFPTVVTNRQLCFYQTFLFTLRGWLMKVHLLKCFRLTESILYIIIIALFSIKLPSLLNLNLFKFILLHITYKYICTLYMCIVYVHFNCKFVNNPAYLHLTYAIMIFLYRLTE